MKLLVNILLRCAFVDKIIVSNNNTNITIEDWIPTNDHRIVFRNEQENSFAIGRFFIAVQEPAEYFLCMDDDIFLRPNQLRVLAEALMNQPETIHGMFGTNLEKDEQGCPFLHRGQFGLTGPLDFIQRVYFFTNDHVTKFMQLLHFAKQQQLAFYDELKLCDDILLSFSSIGKPMCHDIGLFVDDSTSNKQGIALFANDSFVETRTRIASQLAIAALKLGNG